MQLENECIDGSVVNGLQQITPFSFISKKPVGY